ncbi:MoxR family ATPase [Arenimonas sp.]|uniref:AAA family ATPase n=1 Tax=Arenimonas sp. TaxID=1872635 RepID=UPI0025C5B442|nr:MoxR family ATPase [Arenimonas sp.]
MANGVMTVAEVVARLQAAGDSAPKAAAGAPRSAGGDLRDGSIYLLDEPLRLAMQVAVATGRPLLLTGDPGSGKSSLAAWLAERLGWRYYERVITGRTEAADLLYQFDTVRKLGDAAGKPSLDDRRYVEPGVLWWALDREGARRRGATEGSPRPRAGAMASEPQAALNARRSKHHAVVLIDEIDKADPDVPNALLVPLGSGQFPVTETQVTVQRVTPATRKKGTPAAPLFVVITSNGERELPPAFVRRCVTHQLASPDAARLETIAHAHAAREGHALDADETKRIQELARQAVRIREELRQMDRKGAGTAEFLDAVRASRELGLAPARKDEWERLLSLTLRKAAARP